MPLCTLHLIRLHRDGNGDVNQDRIYAKRKQFLQRLVTSPLGARLIVACVIRRPIIVANRIDPVYLNATRWDLLLIISPEKDLPQTGKARQEDPPTPFSLKDQPKIQDDISDEYLLDIGVPTKILDAYSQRSKSFKEEAQKAKKIKIESLVENPARAHPGYKPKTSQLLEMSDDLVALSKELEELASSDGLVDANGPVQQLNLLCFKKSKEDKDRYYKYGQVSLILFFDTNSTFVTDLPFVRSVGVCQCGCQIWWCAKDTRRCSDSRNTGSATTSMG